MQFREQHATPTVQKEQTVAGDALKAIRQGLSLAWLHQETEAEQFQAFIGLSDKDKLDLLAYCVATSLKPQLSDRPRIDRLRAGPVADRCQHGRLLASDAEQLSWPDHPRPVAGPRPRVAWRPVGTGQSRDKKGELADALERAFADPQKVACTPEQREKLKGWLPEGMAFDTDDAGQPAAEANRRIAA